MMGFLRSALEKPELSPIAAIALCYNLLERDVRNISSLLSVFNGYGTNISVYVNVD
ncbi:hypothetical protein [Synechocystis sp. FACHB-383]|uniref:hypothetical protein n=1 Tax=Synechocystis sp. FACHB-383 TaxID=2692864 RepID=UPI001F54EAED|nr:hypothetical protein [Synechocystis sp. FACHB-383]